MLDPSFLNAVNTDILPAADNAYDLGSSSLRWRSAHVNSLNIISETLVGQTVDPPLAAGKIWFRSDLKQIRWSPDGSAVKQVYPADWDDITNKPSTFPPSAHASRHAHGGPDALGDDALRFRQIGIERAPSHSVSIPPLGTYTIPRGVYYVRTDSYTVIQLYDDIDRRWVDIVGVSSCELVISDGVNVRAWNFDTVYTGVIKLFPFT